MSVLGRRRNREEDADEKAADNLHSALLDLLVPGYGKTAPERARDRERMDRILKEARSKEGEGRDIA